MLLVEIEAEEGREELADVEGFTALDCGERAVVLRVEELGARPPPRTGGGLWWLLGP